MFERISSLRASPHPAYAIVPVVFIAIAMIAGCGGGAMSSSDMQKYAIRRAPDVEVKLQTPAKKNATDKDRVPRGDDELAATAEVASDANESSKLSAPPIALPAASERVTAPADENATLPTNTTATAESPPPDIASDPQERARRTVDNMRRIGTAFEAYLDDKRLYPTRAVFDKASRPLLSWRVALLPYLGHQELHARFRLNEPWNSRHNAELLALIPPVYQSPERFDERTNYLVPVASSTIFGKKRGVPANNIEDGPENTVLILEADDAAAVPWTEPRDYELNLNEPTKNLGSLRADSVFVIWGGGEVGRVLTTAPMSALRAMFTADAGEDFVAGHIDQPLFTSGAEKSPTFEDSSTITATVDEPDGMSGEKSSASMAVADPALASLAAKYLKHSANAFAEAQPREATQWFYAAAVVGPPGGDWPERYRWVPALRRPTPVVRFGIGLEYSGSRANQLQQATLTKPSGGVRQQSRAWTMITGELGAQIVAALATHGDQHGAGSLLGSSQIASGTRARVRRQPSLLTPTHVTPLAGNVCFLAVAREPVLLQVARREAIDVLLVLDWRDAGHKWTAGLKLVDVAREQRLINLPRLSSEKLDEASRNPLATNLLVDWLRELEEYLEEQLVMQPLPKQVQPSHVARRMEGLASAKVKNPLPVLAELRFYRELGLADDAQLVLAYQKLIGDKAGIELMLGDATAKQRAINDWLPAPLPVKTVSSGHTARDTD